MFATFEKNIGDCAFVWIAADGKLEYSAGRVPVRLPLNPSGGRAGGSPQPGSWSGRQVDFLMPLENPCLGFAVRWCKHMDWLQPQPWVSAGTFKTLTFKTSPLYLKTPTPFKSSGPWH